MSNTRITAGPGFRICFDDEPHYLRGYVFDGTDSQAVFSDANLDQAEAGVLAGIFAAAVVSRPWRNFCTSSAASVSMCPSR